MLGFNADQVLALVRGVIKFGGGLLVAKGFGDAAAWEIVAGGGATLASILMSHYTHSK